MGICKGNRGNLMQHWTFAEVLTSLNSDSKIHLVTTHSMAPWAIPEGKERENSCRRIFRLAGKRLENHQNLSKYETAWKSLTVDAGLPYPSTAAFATKLSKAEGISVGLCEYDSQTADEIEGFLSNDDLAGHFSHAILFRGDWRGAIQSPSIWNNTADCLYIEMDPMRYDTTNHTRKTTHPYNVYPEDLHTLLGSLPQTPKATVVQLSSFSTVNNNMPLDAQRDSMVSVLSSKGFQLQGETRVGMQMASFIFTRDLQLQCGDLQGRFATWLKGIE